MAKENGGESTELPPVSGDEKEILFAMEYIHAVLATDGIQVSEFKNVDEDLAHELLHLAEKPQLREISDQVTSLVAARGYESYPVKFMLYDDGKFEEADPKILNYNPETVYYNRIFSELHNKITDELAGKNEYDRVEDHTSRRFVYTDDTCISFIQVGIRERVMDFHVVVRSTDVKNIFPHDLRFLYYLASTCYDRFNNLVDCARMRFNLNSAHIIS